jgi:hypothetical protein
MLKLKNNLIKFFFIILDELVPMFFYLLIWLILIINDFILFKFFSDLNTLERLFTLGVISLIFYFALLLVLLPKQNKISQAYEIWKEKKKASWIG